MCNERQLSAIDNIIITIIIIHAITNIYLVSLDKRTDKRKCDAATLQPLSRFNYQQPTATLTHQPNTIMIMIDLHCHHH